MGPMTSTERRAELHSQIARFTRERGWGRFHNPKNLAMAMIKEAAEVVELFQWLTPAQAAKLTPALRRELADELADTYVYLTMLAGRFGLDLDEAALAKMKRNVKKHPVRRARR